jgi:hypothetical protein
MKMGMVNNGTLNNMNVILTVYIDKGNMQCITVSLKGKNPLWGFALGGIYG